MKITIDRTHCALRQFYCDRHVAKLIRFPLHEDRPAGVNLGGQKWRQRGHLDIERKGPGGSGT